MQRGGGGGSMKGGRGEFGARMKGAGPRSGQVGGHNQKGGRGEQLRAFGARAAFAEARGDADPEVNLLILSRFRLTGFIISPRAR